MSIVPARSVAAIATWLFVFALTLSGAACAAAPDWGGLDWLLGRWTADGGGVQQGTGGFSFEREAGGQVLLRRNFADYPARDGKPPNRHEDLMVIAHDGAAIRAIYWDSEGHTIHYVLTAPGADDVVFLSEDPEGPRFRLTYRRTTRGLVGRFEIAPPNRPADFHDYLTWTARRAK